MQLQFVFTLYTYRCHIVVHHHFHVITIVIIITIITIIICGTCAE